MDEGIEKAVSVFSEVFGGRPEIKVFAPGRVNLIGEHVDYNDGFVLPFALPFRTIIVGSKSKSKSSIVSRICSVTMTNDSKPVPVSFEINEKLSKGSPSWANYVKGTIFQYLGDLPKFAAFDAVVWSNVPIGSGLSSSAALEVAMATFLEQLYGLSHISGVTKALRCQQAEHTFADTPCGIMDQFISALGRDGNLLLIDCRSQIGTLVPFGSGDQSAVVLVTNSKVKHALSDSEYPLRVIQCREAMIVLKQSFPAIIALRDVTMDMLDSVKSSLSELAYKRAKHNITENERTLAAVEALKTGDFTTVGKLMSASHESLAHGFEVSCPELDILKELALKVPGVYGSRMTGGGFGGCTVTLVDKKSIDNLKKYLKKEYFSRTGLHCECYDAEPSAGAGVCEMKNGNQKEGSGDVVDMMLNHINWMIVPVTVLALVIGISIHILRK